MTNPTNGDEKTLELPNVNFTMAMLAAGKPRTDKNRKGTTMTTTYVPLSDAPERRQSGRKGPVAK